MELERLMQYNKKAPIEMQDDIKAISQHVWSVWDKVIKQKRTLVTFEDKLSICRYFFVLWCLREPTRIKKFSQICDWRQPFALDHYEKAQKAKVLGRRYISSRQLHFLKPQHVRKWSLHTINKAMRALCNAVLPMVGFDLMRRHKEAVVALKSLRGIDNYGAEHAYRAAALCFGIPHPAHDWVIMGEYCNRKDYEIFERGGLGNISDVNIELVSMGHEQVNGGILAYLICEDKRKSKRKKVMNLC